MDIYIYSVYRFQSVVLRCPKRRLHSRFLECVFFFFRVMGCWPIDPQPGRPVYLSLSVCSPLTCPARVVLPVATLPAAKLSGSLHHASLLTWQKMPSSRWRYFNECKFKIPLLKVLFPWFSITSITFELL